MGVVVFGSLNVDVVFKCEAMPKPGETVLCPSYTTGPGGKGLNQAVAARRAGSDVTMVGAIGKDGYGSDLEQFLASEGIEIDGVRKIAGAATGVAHIAVDASGENAIIVASGANASLETWPGTSASASAWLAQLEISHVAVADFFRSGRAVGAICILNAAPAIRDAKVLFPLCDIIVVNEHELAEFAGIGCDPSDHNQLEVAASSVVNLREQVLVITLGAVGTLIIGSMGRSFVAATKVTPCDTTGAGDCFCGVLADGVSRGLDVVEAAKRASIAAALAVQREGAALAMPFASEIIAFAASAA